MMDKFKYSSVMQVPKLTKICVNQGVGLATSDKKMVDTAVQELSMITGQKAVKTIAKKSISNFRTSTIKGGTIESIINPLLCAGSEGV